jgi:hypothetical protein
MEKNVKIAFKFFSVLLVLFIIFGVWIGLSLFAYVFKFIMMAGAITLGLHISNKYKNQ